MVITRTNGTTSTYSGAGRSREPSRKIRDGGKRARVHLRGIPITKYDCIEAEAEEQVEPPRKKGRIKKDRTSNTNAENCARECIPVCAHDGLKNRPYHNPTASTQPAEVRLSSLHHL